MNKRLLYSALAPLVLAALYLAGVWIGYADGGTGSDPWVFGLAVLPYAFGVVAVLIALYLIVHLWWDWVKKGK